MYLKHIVSFMNMFQMNIVVLQTEGASIVMQFSPHAVQTWVAYHTNLVICAIRTRKRKKEKLLQLL